jgi:hypothetical protein
MFAAPLMDCGSPVAATIELPLRHPAKLQQPDFLQITNAGPASVRNGQSLLAKRGGTGQPLHPCAFPECERI